MFLLKSSLIYIMILIAIIMAAIAALAYETPKEMQKSETQVVIVLSVVFLVIYFLAMQI